MTRATNNNAAAYQQQQQPYPQRRQLPAGTPQSPLRTSQRGAERSGPPPQQPITRRPQQKTTAAYDADTLQKDEYDEEASDDDALDGYPMRTPSSVVPYRYTRLDYPQTEQRPMRASLPPAERRPARQSIPDAPATTRPAPRRRWRWHPLFYVGLGLLIMVLGYLLFGAVSTWWQTTVDGWQYGYPRTYQTDAVVGHHDSPANPSHFIAINLHSHIEVIEFPGGDVTHARVYLGPTLIGTGQDLAPVTLSFRDVNGDGKPDMIVSVGGTIVVFINDGGQFRPLKPGEQVTL
jgi:hypothetical protein